MPPYMKSLWLRLVHHQIPKKKINDVSLTFSVFVLSGGGSPTLTACFHVFTCKSFPKSIHYYGNLCHFLYVNKTPPNSFLVEGEYAWSRQNIFYFHRQTIQGMCATGSQHKQMSGSIGKCNTSPHVVSIYCLSCFCLHNSL